MIRYFPISMHTVEWRLPSINRAREGAARFKQLNGVLPLIVTREDMEARGIRPTNPKWYPMWFWEFVPAEFDYAMVFDSKLLPVRPLPELSELEFAATLDRHDRVNQGVVHTPTLRRTQKIFQPHFYVAHRKTKPVFEQLQLLHDNQKYIGGDGNGFDGRWYCTPLNDHIQSNFEMTWLPKEWNWVMFYEKQFYTEDPYMINMNGDGTWAHWRYILHLFTRMEAVGLNP